MDETGQDQIVVDTVVPALQPGTMAQIRGLLAGRGLDPDADVELYCVARAGDRPVACIGLDRDVVKCAALTDEVRGTGVLEQLVTELTYEALDRGVSHLFLYTKPENEQAFAGCGFHTIVAVPDAAVLMENTRSGIRKWAEELSHYRRHRAKVGAVVVNCNPFTLGHRHLIRQAARDCDYLHVFVVSEDSSLVPYADRLALVRAGVADLPERDHIHVHPGSTYLVSRATFPAYFLKDRALVDRAATAIDLRIFREWVAPALGITHRYVGDEPFCAVTRGYNEDMPRRLSAPDPRHAPVAVVQIPRLAAGGVPISATHVRERVLAGRLAGLEELVPPTTYAYLVATYGSPADKERATALVNANAARMVPAGHGAHHRLTITG